MSFLFQTSPPRFHRFDPQEIEYCIYIYIYMIYTGPIPGLPRAVVLCQRVFP